MKTLCGSLPGDLLTRAAVGSQENSGCFGCGDLGRKVGVVGGRKRPGRQAGVIRSDAIGTALSGRV